MSLCDLVPSQPVAKHSYCKIPLEAATATKHNTRQRAYEQEEGSHPDDKRCGANQVFRFNTSISFDDRLLDDIAPLHGERRNRSDEATDSPRPIERPAGGKKVRRPPSRGA